MSIVDLRLQNDLYCVGWGVKLYSLNTTVMNLYYEASLLRLI